jgi:hypothetical protein
MTYPHSTNLAGERKFTEKSHAQTLGFGFTYLVRKLLSLFAILVLTLSSSISAKADSSPLLDSRVPSNPIPALSKVIADRPIPYQDRCHVQQNLNATDAECIYGNPSGDTSIVLYGDSHALSWFTPIEKLASIKGWKFYSYTMSSCWPADIVPFNSTKYEVMENCEHWRTDTINTIKQIKPYMVLVSGTRGFTTLDENGLVPIGSERTSIWVDGMTRTLQALHSATKNLVYIADVPSARDDVVTCLIAHPESIKACSLTRAAAISTSWLNKENQVATDNGAIFVDPTDWICSTDPCSPLQGRYVKYVNAGHLTATYMRLLEAPLWRVINTKLVNSPSTKN